jgi:hypothetical protein
MGLRELAQSDLRAILNDRTGGFGWDITLRNPDGVELALVGFANDIEQSIDRETGLAIVGREASIALSLADLGNFGVPKGVPDTDRKPWVVRFKDIVCVPWTFKVKQAIPDRAAGIVVCILETYLQP